jgi:hypothetical protein
MTISLKLDLDHTDLHLLFIADRGLPQTRRSETLNLNHKPCALLGVDDELRNKRIASEVCDAIKLNVLVDWRFALDFKTARAHWPPVLAIEHDFYAAQ